MTEDRRDERTPEEGGSESYEAEIQAEREGKAAPPIDDDDETPLDVAYQPKTG